MANNQSSRIVKKMTIVILALQCVPIVRSYSFDSSTNEPFSDAIASLVNFHFKDYPGKINIRTLTTIGKTASRLDDVLDHTLHRLNENISYELGANMTTGGHKTKFQLILIDEYMDLQPTSTNGQHILVAAFRLRNSTDVEKILADYWKMNMADVYVLTQLAGSDTLVLHTNIPYSPNNCGSVNAVVVNYFRNGRFDSDAHIFVDNFNNLHGCPMNVWTQNFPPTMMVRREMGVEFLDGIEGHLMKYLAARMHFTIVVRNARGLIREKLGEMLERNVSTIAVGSLLDIPESRTNYSVTSSYTTLSFGFVLPLGVPFTALQRTLLPFQKGVWISLIVVLIISIIIGRPLFRLSMFNHIEMVLIGRANLVSAASSQRVLLASLMLAMMVISDAYQGSLFDFMRRNIRDQPVRTTEDLERFDYSIASTRLMIKIISQNMPQLRKKLIERKFSEIFEGNVDMGRRFDEPLVSSKDRFMVVNFAMYLQKGSSLAKPIDDALGVVKSNGLIVFWQRLFTIDLNRKFYEKKSLKRISVTELSGIFYICATLHFIAYLLFIGEIIIWNARQ